MLATQPTPTRQNPPGRPTLKAIRALEPLTNSESIGLKMVPHLAMIELEAKRGVKRDWEAVAFRVMAAYEVAKKCYAKYVADYIDDAVSVMAAMAVRGKQGQPYQFRNYDELGLVSDVLRLMDDFQDRESRETMIFCFRKAQTQIIKIS